MLARREVEDEDQRDLRRNTNTSRMSARREAEDEDQRNLRNTNTIRMSARREAEDEDQRNLRRNTNTSRMSARREAEDEDQRNLRNTNTSRMLARREVEDEDQRNLRRNTNTSRMCAEDATCPECVVWPDWQCKLVGMKTEEAKKEKPVRIKSRETSVESSSARTTLVQVLSGACNPYREHCVTGSSDVVLPPWSAVPRTPGSSPRDDFLIALFYVWVPPGPSA
ncbi:uncharacterized protein [Palaemon carinicauda]|uniref:uncharacterized protein n=1 Tax=Palaemon carinicauda TaxID=392227 RepID=UPI0035B64CB3